MVTEVKVGNLSCGGICLKVFLGIVNIAFFICGLAIAGFGKFFYYVFLIQNAAPGFRSQPPCGSEVMEVGL